MALTIQLFILISLMFIIGMAGVVKRPVGGYYGSSSSDSSISTGAIVGIVLGFVCGPFILLFCVFIITLGWRLLKERLVGEPFLSNEHYIQDGTVKEPSNLTESVFISGIFQYYYFQCETARGPFSMRLDFNSHAEYTVEGGGEDDIGTYVITGVYSPKTLRMGLKKQYQARTGNSSANLGHKITIQVQWSFVRQQFDGKYYLRTKLHSDQKSVVIRPEHPNDFESLYL